MLTIKDRITWLCGYKNYTHCHLVAGSEDILFQRYGRYGITKIWMDDILPCRAYLRHWWVPSYMHETLTSIDYWFHVPRSRELFISLVLAWCLHNRKYWQMTRRHYLQISWQILKIFCSVLAAKNLSDMAYDNFLDHTFLGDRGTTIREYLAHSGSGIMKEEPPEDLKHRYGGWTCLHNSQEDICWQVSIFLSNLFGLEPDYRQHEMVRIVLSIYVDC